jgi:hypothetical protein
VPQRQPVWADRPKWLLGQANSIGPQAEMPVLCGYFPVFSFIFNF